jgi:hypothetical protein
MVGAETVSEYVFVPIVFGFPESVAATVKENVPAAVGVPLRTPEPERLNPGGNVPLTTVNV